MIKNKRTIESFILLRELILVRHYREQDRYLSETKQC